MPTALFNNSTIPDFRPIEVNMPALDIMRESTFSAGDATVEISLSSLLFGVLTVLSLTAIFFLIRQGSLAQTNAKVLVLTTILLYVSTGTYIAALVWNRSQANSLVLGATNGLFTESYDGNRETTTFEDAVRKESLMAVIALVTNCIIGDGIVWWRACVIWRNKAVYCIGPLLVALAIGWSDFPTVFDFVGYHEPQIIPTTRVTLLSTDDAAFVKTAAIISFIIHALATVLIAYKTWEHRQLVKKHFSTAGIKSQVLNALALLVECGSIYCAVLVFVIVYEADPEAFLGSAGRVFARVAECFVYGCLTPLVAIYPIIIIVLVALKRSPIDTGGLSSLHQAYNAASPADQGTGSTIVFHNSMICSSAGCGTEDAIEERSWASDPGSAHSQQSPIIKKHGTVVGSLV